MEKSLWPQVDSEEGRAFAFQLAAVGGFMLAAATGAAFVAVLSGFQSEIGYSPDVPVIPLLAALAGIAISSLSLGFMLRKHQAVSAWLFSTLVLACFLANAWWGSGSALWLVVVLGTLSLQGIRACLGKKRSLDRSVS